MSPERPSKHRLLTDHLDIWTAADTAKKSGRGRSSGNAASVYGIKKLRELIFELAALGRLVDEDIHQPAKIMKLGEIAEFVMGQAPPGSECNTNGNGTVFVKTGEFGNLFPEVCEWTTKPLKFAKSGDVLICVVGATVGKLNLAIDCAIGRSVAAIRPATQLDTNYLYFALMPFTLRLRAQSRGSAQGVIGKAELNAVQIRLPSLAEQHRIVAKVDELMALCDLLEQEQTDNSNAHQTLVETLLATLTQAEGGGDFAVAWQRIAAYFDALFTTEQSIDQLKQTILQLAVMGKLVSQDPSDEPASELLKRIHAEKAKLIAEGKIKKDKPLPPITEDEKPFELPQGWEWVRLDEVANLITKGSSPKWQGVSYTENPDDVMFVTSENVGSYRLLLDSPKYVEKKFNDIEPRSILVTGDFLMNIVGASIGRTAIYNLGTLANINQAVCLIRISNSNLSRMFLLHFFNSATCLEYMFDKQVENARPNLSMGNIAKFLIPIPPVEEQHRIVAKVDELMALCDALKARLNEAQTTQVQLADAVVEQAVG